MSMSPIPPIPAIPVPLADAAAAVPVAPMSIMEEAVDMTIAAVLEAMLMLLVPIFILKSGRV